MNLDKKKQTACPVCWRPLCTYKVLVLGEWKGMGKWLMHDFCLPEATAVMESEELVVSLRVNKDAT